MKKMEKRFVTRQFYWGHNRDWNVWDKMECKWMFKIGCCGRERALKFADEMNNEYYKEIFK